MGRHVFLITQAQIRGRGAAVAVPHLTAPLMWAETGQPSVQILLLPSRPSHLYTTLSHLPPCHNQVNLLPYPGPPLDM